MMPKPRNRHGHITAGLRIALWAGYVLRPFAIALLRRRLTRGKEDPQRWKEKLGDCHAPRPDGSLVWLHGVGLGEVLALRALVAGLSAVQPDLRFLITYSTRSAGVVISRNLPRGCQHQFLPLDLPGIVDRFLDHWRPDLAVWTDQEIWPRLSYLLNHRGIPQAIVACRISQISFESRRRFQSFYRGLYSLPELIEAQDEVTARSILQFSGRVVPVTGSLKPAVDVLSAAADHEGISDALRDRDVWLLSSSHPADEEIAISAHSRLILSRPEELLIIAPRDPSRGAEIAVKARALGLTVCQRDELPSCGVKVWVADSIGELGSWYRIARAALIGGTFDATEGHNPWEAVALGAAIFFGPCTANFATDFARLSRAGAALQIGSADDLVDALLSSDLDGMSEVAYMERSIAAEAVKGIAGRLVALMKTK